MIPDPDRCFAVGLPSTEDGQVVLRREVVLGVKAVRDE